jgi:hypothetical protein
MPVNLQYRIPSSSLTDIEDRTKDNLLLLVGDYTIPNQAGHGCSKISPRQPTDGLSVCVECPISPVQYQARTVSQNGPEYLYGSYEHQRQLLVRHVSARKASIEL